MGWLVAAGHVSEPEALLVVDTAAFEAVDVVPLTGRRRPWRTAALAASAVAVALAAALAFGGDEAIESARGLLRAARAWLPISSAER